MLEKMKVNIQKSAREKMSGTSGSNNEKKNIAEVPVKSIIQDGTSRRNKCLLLVYFVVTSFIFLTICSKNSFLYPFNNGVDINCFLTVGKGIVNGMVPYRDMFEQKGPVVYFLYSLAYLLNPNGYIGVFVLEIISLSVFLFFCYKIFSLYIREKQQFIVIAPILLFAMFTGKVFFQGGQVEEFVLPFLAGTLYITLKHFKDEHKHSALSYNSYLILGVCASVVLWTKYTMLTFWGVILVGVFVAELANKRLKHTLVGVCVFFGGVAIVTVPVLLYFMVNGAVDSLIEEYFLRNILSYDSSGENMGLIRRMFESLVVVCKRFFEVVKRYSLMMYLSIGGIIVFMLSKKYVTSIIFKFTILLSSLALFYGVYFNKRKSDYYALIFVVFAVFGLIVLCDFMNYWWKVHKGFVRKRLSSKPGFSRLITKLKVTSLRQVLLPVAAILLVVCVWGEYNTNCNVVFMKETKENSPQYRFAEIINETPNSTMLNYDFLDGGFYYAADKLPTNKYFAKMNFFYESFPEMYDTQRKMVENKEVDFVVCRYAADGEYSDRAVLDNYDLVSKEVYNNGDRGRKSTFALYRAKP